MIEICIIVCVPDIKMYMFKPNAQLTVISGYGYIYIPLKALNVFVKCSYDHKILVTLYNAFVRTFSSSYQSKI